MNIYPSVIEECQSAIQSNRAAIEQCKVDMLLLDARASAPEIVRCKKALAERLETCRERLNIALETLEKEEAQEITDSRNAIERAAAALRVTKSDGEKARLYQTIDAHERKILERKKIIAARDTNKEVVGREGEDDKPE